MRSIGILKWFARVKPILWRALICWGLGCVLLFTDDSSRLDFRFTIRGEQTPNSDVVIVKIRREDLAKAMSARRPVDRPRARAWQVGSLRDVSELTDSFYWEPTLWKQLLSQLLNYGPRAIGVTLFFSDRLNKSMLNETDRGVFSDSRIIWAALPLGAEPGLMPLFYDPSAKTNGDYEFMRDDDGVIRRFAGGLPGFAHLTERMTGTVFDDHYPRLINYRGPSHVWPEYTVSEIVEGSVSAESFAGKYILIGAEDETGTTYLTPLGPASRSTVMANVLDNLISDRFIQLSPRSIFAFMLFFLLALCVFFLIQYPQAVAAVFLLWTLTMITALSLWIFDTFSIWTPVFSPAVQMLATWIVFVGYQANRFEIKNFELKQARRTHEELEQLKNNFISLISHDLKTPIAKAQAVLDRLLATKPSENLVGDLQLLRRFNDELLRYIQSILRLLRVESRDFKLTIEVGDINATIEDVAQQVQPLIEQKGLRLDLELEPLFSIEGDFTLLREVILNLLENAVKYTPSGGRIRIRSFELDEQIVVQIIDTGPGIPQKELAEVWRKFVRGKGHELTTAGTGLGLYLVKYFIELHGGTVQLESEEGAGTTAAVRLPFEQEPRH